MQEQLFSQAVKTRVDLRLRRIADVLLLNGSFTDNPGLINGKIGIELFFHNYTLNTCKIESNKIKPRKRRAGDFPLALCHV
jgi:hypothetical protein